MPPPVEVFELSADFVASTEVWLSVKPLDGISSDFSVRRDGVEIFAGKVDSFGTLVIDTGPVPAQAYEYSARRIENGQETELPSKLKSSRIIQIHSTPGL